MLNILTSIIPIAILGIIIYLIFRPKENHVSHNFKDAYFYIVSFFALIFVFWAVTDLIRIVLEHNLFPPAYRSYYNSVSNNEDYLRGISLRVSTFIVAFPVYFFHWHKALQKHTNDVNYFHKRTYLIIVLILSAIVGLGVGIALVYILMNTLLGVNDGNNQELSFVIPYFLGSAVVWVLHFMSYRKLTMEKTSPAESEVKESDTGNSIPPADKASL